MTILRGTRGGPAWCLDMLHSFMIIRESVDITYLYICMYGQIMSPQQTDSPTPGKNDSSLNKLGEHEPPVVTLKSSHLKML